jgi:hypothetical protein
MTKSRVGVTRNAAVRSWSRREVLARGAGVASVLALPELWMPKAWGAAAPGFDYYISTTGNDSNPGTLAAPWALTSLQNTSPNNAKIAGKRLGIIAGNYSMAGITSSNQANEWNLLSIPGGISASQPTYVASSDSGGNYSPRASTITWTGGATVNGIMGGVPGSSTNWITIDGLRINGNGLDATSNGGGHLVMFNNTSASRTSALSATCTGLSVVNCELWGISPSVNGGNYSLIFVTGCHNCVFQNNSLHDIASRGAAPPDHAAAVIEIGCYGNQYIYNTVYNSNGCGIQSKEGNTGTIVAYNYFYNVNGTFGQCSVFNGFDGYGGNPNAGPAPTTNLIHHNIVDGCQGVFREAGNTNYMTISCTAYNNTVYDRTSGSLQGWLMYAQGGAIAQYYNNIYVTTSGSDGSAGRPGKLNLNPGAYSNVDYNCYYSVSGSYPAYWGLSSTAYSSLAAWQSAGGADGHSINANPGFAAAIVSGAGAAQFQLGSSSACKGAGRSNGTSSGSACDIGAWGNGATQIGCNFALGSGTASNPVPNAPTLSVS